MRFGRHQPGSKVGEIHRQTLQEPEVGRASNREVKWLDWNSFSSLIVSSNRAKVLLGFYGLALNGDSGYQLIARLETCGRLFWSAFWGLVRPPTLGSFRVGVRT
jgi:hypothetical protein